jgi:type IV fimbrial biogenesis protein FimT
MKRRDQGFSMIELVIAITIMGVLLALAMPSFTSYMRDSKLRAAAESFLSGIQLARSEAVRRNAPVEFLLTSDDPTVANVGSATASATGPNWMVRTADLTEFIEGKFAADGANGLRINDTTSPASDDSGDPPPGTLVSSIIFNGFGRTAMGADAAFKFTIPQVKCQTDSGPVRCLRVAVSVFGQARLCDPKVAAGDTRRC